MFPRLLPLVFACLLGATLSAPSYAGRHHDNDGGRDEAQNDGRFDGGRDAAAEPRVSLDEAVSRVQGAYRGQVIAASATSSGGHPGYRIRVLLDGGRVRTVFVDAVSGAMRESG